VTDLLERQLVMLSERIDTGDPQLLLDGVWARIDAEPVDRSRARVSRAESPRPRRLWLAIAAVAAVIIIAVLVLPGPRHAVARWFGIGSTRIERAPSPTPDRSSESSDATVPSATTASTSTTVAATFPLQLSFGRPSTAADAASRTGLPVPGSDVLGEPAGIYIVRPPASGQVVVAYAPSETLPASDVAGVGALLSTVRGALDDGSFYKVAATGTEVENFELVTSGGRTVDAVWLAGEPHQFMFRTADGDEVWDTLRLATNTLLWNDDDVIFRLEADIDRETATRIASSIIDGEGTASPPTVSGGS
jgi:hypothetical protein